ncbi:MAG: tRNA dihydrouridine(20/20a) synthase DusA [Ectothiorhodospiraceae bacterium]|nr:tRNA dihydrouridine(20/20a) synthase DusA [Ectothiorhodospiraceae bacterium]
MKTYAHRFQVAPMLDWTDRHCRYFLRLLSRHALLYTEMITTGALIHGDAARFLAYDPAEHPLALQLGGSEPADMARCAAMAEDAGYDEVNINVGCPSDRVSAGRFGACLMAEPRLVAECVAEMRARVSIPVTVKTRIGIDERDSYEHLLDFVDTVAAAGCRTFVVHARKAWLQGLSPKENREIPPLRYDVVHALKHDRPALEIILNGGITTLAQGLEHLDPGQATPLDGIMVGREAYQNPGLLAEVDRLYYGDAHVPPTRGEVVTALLPYVERELARGTRLHAITRHILGLYQGRPGARAWRRILSERACRAGAGIEVLEAALAQVEGRVAV